MDIAEIMVGRNPSTTKKLRIQRNLKNNLLSSYCLLFNLFFNLNLLYSSPIGFFFFFSLSIYRKSWRRRWHPTPVLLPGKSHGQRSLVDCNPWGREESDTTEHLPFHFSLSRIGEGNGNLLQCYCLENARDGGARWAAVYGVTQSRTRLK